MLHRLILVFILSFMGLSPLRVSAYTANKVSFEFLDNGLYRVNVFYTDPELKEFRQSYVLFRKKREAESFYWKLIKGADFYPENPELTRFVPVKMKAEPW